MAKNDKKTNNTRRVTGPPPIDFTPPKKTPAKTVTKERKLSPLPEVKTVSPGLPNRPYDRGRGGQESSRRPAATAPYPKTPKPRDSDRYRTRPLPGASRAQTPPKRFRRRMDPGVKRGISFGITVLILGAFVIMIGLRFFGNNALAVFLDNVQVGYMPMNREITSESFHEEVIANLVDHHQTQVITEQQVTVTPARWVARRNIDDRAAIVSRAGLRMNYQISVRAIYINGHREALVRSDYCIAEIKRRIMSEHENENTVESYFATDWTIQIEVVDHNYEGLLSPMDAIFVLDRTEVVRIPYEVQSGDNLGHIATHFGTTANDIAETNNITTATRIYPGDILYIRTRRPILSVITIDEIVTYSPVEMPVEEIDNPDLDEGHREVTQEGSPGESRTVLRITRLNGETTRTEQLESEIVTPPVTRIIEVGTRPATLERR